MSLKEFKSKFISNTHLKYTDDPKVIDKALSDNHWFVRKSAARNTNATKEHLDKALGDDYPLVREAAAGNTSATKENLDKTLGDKDYRVRKAAAAENPNYKKFYPNGR